jgi:hypothetical protein
MKRQYGKIMQRIAALMLGAFLFASPMAQAAVNTAIGDIAGTPGDLVNSDPFTLNTSTPTLVKTAFLTSNGDPLTDGATLPVGTLVDFLIYINNESDVVLDDVGIQDTLVGFTYQAGTIRVLNTTTECAVAVCTSGFGSEEEGIYDDVVGETPLSDSFGDDAASFLAAVVEVGNNGVQTTNAVQNAAANFVLAVVFTARLD